MYIGDFRPIQMVDWSSSYINLIRSLYLDIILENRDHDYQGDMYYLLKNEDKYGYLVFGFGSCSGCDALEGCNNDNHADNLRREIYDQIQWFNSNEDCVNHFMNLDMKYRSGESLEFKENVLNYFKGEQKEHDN